MDYFHLLLAQVVLISLHLNLKLTYKVSHTFIEKKEDKLIEFRYHSNGIQVKRSIQSITHIALCCLGSIQKARNDEI